ncbi:40S ribosomal protein S5-1 [Hordeum vulgare]|nr:40S ribosomal protein S5-1 [Hordeum vulgare]
MTSDAGAKDDARTLELGDGAGKPVRGDEDEGGMGFGDEVVNPYPPEVMRHPQAIEMHEGVLHIQDVQRPKKEGSEKGRLTTVEHEILKYQGMVERGFSANHSMIMNFIRENKLDTQKVG